MNEEQFNRLLLWQQESAQIGCSVTRHEKALALFDGDENFHVGPDGSVGFIDHAKSQTFEEASAYDSGYWDSRRAHVAEHGHWFS